MRSRRLARERHRLKLKRSDARIEPRGGARGADDNAVSVRGICRPGAGWSGIHPFIAEQGESW